MLIPIIVTLLSFIFVCHSYVDIPCEWTNSGANFDLRPLTVTQQNAPSYTIIDGDIPCTPEKEPAFSYVWNFCSAVTQVPDTCSNMGKSGVALQWINLGKDGSDCYIIGKYDSNKDDLSYKLIDSSDPTKGISMSYPTGEKCDTFGVMRSATIDVQCANTKTTIISAQEPSPCQYHMTMKSVYGCPTVK